MIGTGGLGACRSEKGALDGESQNTRARFFGNEIWIENIPKELPRLGSNLTEDARRSRPYSFRSVWHIATNQPRDLDPRPTLFPFKGHCREMILLFAIRSPMSTLQPPILQMTRKPSRGAEVFYAIASFEQNVVSPVAPVRRRSNCTSSRRAFSCFRDDSALPSAKDLRQKEVKRLPTDRGLLDRMIFGQAQEKRL